jgi:adenosylcobyric acid synthase
MLGRTIDDHVESGAGAVAGLARLPVATRFEATKITRPRHGTALLPGASAAGGPLPVAGYQIHHGRSASGAPWIKLDDRWGAQPEGAVSADGAVLGTSLHGLFESDAFRVAFLEAVAARRGKAFRSSGLVFAAAREEQFDRLADLVESHLDMAALERLIGRAAPVPVPAPTPEPA